MFRHVFAMVIASGIASAATAQVTMRPTPAPLVTAERDAWYLNGDPISYGGQLYYPAGAQVYFNGNEMVQSGSFSGVPLFVRTTIEPGSIVYVPVGGGLLQPYERLRAGELAGTVGSRTPSFPVALSPDAYLTTAQAAGAPMLGTVVLAREDPTPPRFIEEGARPVATAGRPQAAQQPMHVRIGERPTGLNAIFIEFQGKRWFSTGTTVEIDASAMTRTGEYFGFPVWTRPQDERIYVSTSKSGSLAVPYSSTPTPIGKEDREGMRQ